MKAQETNKKIWTKPVVKVLDIKKDTFSGSNPGPEGGGTYYKNASMLPSRK